jgi:hypothetical protein
MKQIFKTLSFMSKVLVLVQIIASGATSTLSAVVADITQPKVMQKPKEDILQIKESGNKTQMPEAAHPRLYKCELITKEKSGKEEVWDVGLLKTKKEGKEIVKACAKKKSVQEIVKYLNGDLKNLQAVRIHEGEGRKLRPILKDMLKSANPAFTNPEVEEVD